MPAAPSLTEKTAAALLLEYPIISGHLEAFALLPQGLFNENARIVVGGKTFVVKKMVPGRSEERHRYGATMQKVLAEGGFPCPQIIGNKDGEVITSLQGSLWSMQTWAEGRFCPPEQQDGPNGTMIRAAIASALGRLHAMASEGRNDGRIAPAPDDALLTIPAMISRVNGSCKKIFSGSLLRPSFATKLKFQLRKSSLQKEIHTMLPLLEKGCCQLTAWDAAHHESLQKTSPCHGDINWENLFFDDSKLTAVLDFDNAMEMSPAYDAAAAAAAICGNNPQYLDNFFTAYEEAGGAALAPATLPNLMLLKYVRSLLWQISVVQSGGSGNDGMARRWMAFLAKNIKLLVED